MKKIFHAILFVSLFIWQLPQNIVALVMLPFLGRKRLIRYEHFCFAYDCDGMSGGISLGNFAFLSNYSARKEAVVRHEQRGHTLQSKILGPLYLIIIGIPSILHAAFHKNCPCYYHFYTENWANKLADVEVLYTSNGRCFLSLKSLD